MPKISFIVPVYKVEEYLPHSLETIKNQSLPDWEAILVDDGSPDTCGEICDRAAAEDSRFRVIHKENGGIGSARNAGLDIARGEYIHFLDSDDSLELNMAEELTALADSCSADVVLFSKYEELMDGERLVSSRIVKPPVTGIFSGEPFKTHFDKLADQHIVTEKLFRRSIIEKNKTRFNDRKVGEDGCFLAELMYADPRCIAAVDKPYYHYRLQRSSSASNSFYPERVKDNFYLSDTIAAVVKSWGLENVKMYRETLEYCLLQDLQFSIKNMSLSPFSFSKRRAWLKEISSDPKVKAAIRDIPASKFQSRNDRTKLLCLKLKCYGTVTLLSSLNRKI